MKIYIPNHDETPSVAVNNGSYLLFITSSGLTRYPTVNPQPDVDYDTTSPHRNKIIIMGVDMI